MTALEHFRKSPAIEPKEKYKLNRPRVGDPVTYRGKITGMVARVEGALCWNKYNDNHECAGETLPFIWCFREGLNTLHDWPTKA